MQVEMPFGETTIQAELPDDTFVIPAGGVKTQFEPIDDLAGAVESALANPLDSKPIRDLVGPGSKVAIAFDDPTAPCFSSLRGIAIKAVLAELDAAGVARESVT
ncbi:MAG: DUF2088 domain-containing protein, partial [Candidatus Hydrogenedentes bacterium]|nr:DUF2088 domain-containing protein [Candidatus Hydrogenedentota bacterium]